MFRILCDPSSGNTELCLDGITHSVSDILSCVWSVFGSVILNLWCVYGLASPVLFRCHVLKSSGFNSQQWQEIFLISKMSMLAVRPT